MDLSPWERLDDFVRVFGPACPDLECNHHHCMTIRQLRRIAEISDERADELGGERCRCTLVDDLDPSKTHAQVFLTGPWPVIDEAARRPPRP